MGVVAMAAAVAVAEWANRMVAVAWMALVGTEEMAEMEVTSRS